jgi:hypothetical protein
MLLASSLFAILLIIWCAPDTPTGRALKAALVDWPALKLARLTRARLLAWVALAAAIGAALMIVDTELLRVMSMAAPDTLAWFATFEMSSLVDLFAMLALVTANTRLRSAGHAIRAAVNAVRRRFGARNRDPRPRRSEERKADNDDADGPAPAFAYAMAA